MFNATLQDIATHYNVNERTVRRWVDSETLTYGREYIDMRVSNGHRASLRFNRDALDKLFATPPEKR